ncbi:MAG: hypothetical protein OEX22_06115 [Cyclobacteriaceae bacterium]|nr:hypothetical protein [Cyclobacteriaceae bacterium]
MKRIKIYTVMVLLFAVACSSGNSINEHSHDGKTEHEHVEDNSSEAEKPNEVVIAEREDSIVLTVPAKKGIEYVFYIKKHEKLTYEWTSDAPIYLQFHGEPMDYEVTKYFEVYTEATSDEMKGIMTLPFEGTHGWYWKNTSENDITVNLKTQGNYSIIGLM